MPAEKKNKNGEEISRDSETDGCEGQQSKREECKSLPAIWRCQSSWCVWAACEISFISHCKTTSFGLNLFYLSQQWYVFKAWPCHPCRYCSGFQEILSFMFLPRFVVKFLMSQTCLEKIQTTAFPTDHWWFRKIQIVVAQAFGVHVCQFALL